MENIQPWCVSRQLWWGHRIPAWFADDGRIFVAESAEEAQAQAGPGVMLRQDQDVLDTWFSSALWPFATLGWPDCGPPRNGEGDQPQAGGGAVDLGDSLAVTAAPPRASRAVPLPVPGRSLGGRYPNDVLISGFDILFFWDARMMMQGLHFMGDVPFKTLYLHGLVRAADGAKMSKSKGNTVDPLGLIDRYGADALRFFMAAMESQGRDIKMDEKRVEGYRNFATKLWNAARFCQANGIGASTTLEPPAATLAVNKWIIAETVTTVQAVDLALADYRFDGAANAIYQFVWSRFCDWYVELIKPVSSGDGRGAIDEETKAVAGWVLDQILVLLHPFMPFITEELWHALGTRDHDLIVGRWPMADARALDPGAAREIEWLIRLVGEVRAARTELNVPPGARVPYAVSGATPETLARLAKHAAIIARLARIDPGASGGEAQVVVDEATYTLALGGIIDLAAERARLAKSIAAAEKERDALAGRLNNPGFVERAKPEAVEKARADHAARSAEAERLSAALARLG